MRDGAGPKILVVDDHEDTRSLLAFWLGGRGYRVVQAANGQKAAEAALREHPDMILMDISMPETDGFAATRRILAYEELYNTAIVAVSALNKEEVRGAAIAAGCADFVFKPIDYKQLENILSRILHKSTRLPGE